MSSDLINGKEEMNSTEKKGGAESNNGKTGGKKVISISLSSDACRNLLVMRSHYGVLASKPSGLASRSYTIEQLLHEAVEKMNSDGLNEPVKKPEKKE